jgi:hypothetical protein
VFVTKVRSYRVWSSTTVSTLNRRPSVKASLTKPRFQRRLGWVGTMDRPPCPQGSFATAPFANLQLFLGTEPPELLDVHLDALSLQHSAKVIRLSRRYLSPSDWVTGVMICGCVCV